MWLVGGLRRRRRHRRLFWLRGGATGAAGATGSGGASGTAGAHRDRRRDRERRRIREPEPGHRRRHRQRRRFRDRRSDGSRRRQGDRRDDGLRWQRSRNLPDDRADRRRSQRDHHLGRRVAHVHRPHPDRLHGKLTGPGGSRFSSARRHGQLAGGVVGLESSVRQRGLHRGLPELVRRGPATTPGTRGYCCTNSEAMQINDVQFARDIVAWLKTNTCRRRETRLRERRLQRWRHDLPAGLRGRRHHCRRRARRLPVRHRKGSAGKRGAGHGREQHRVHMHAPAADRGGCLRRRSGQQHRPL